VSWSRDPPHVRYTNRQAKVRPQDFPKWSKNPTSPTRYGLALEPDREYELQLGTPHGYGS